MIPTRSLYLGFAGSLLLALVFSLLELPDLLAAARPMWVPLMLAYWALREPRLSTTIPAFIMGIALDVLFATPLGQHALGLIIVVYLIERLRSIFVLFPLWQATLVLSVIWALYSFLMFWVDGVTHHQASNWLRWLPVISTTLFWPLLYSIMELMHPQSDDD